MTYPKINFKERKYDLRPRPEQIPRRAKPKEPAGAEASEPLDWSERVRTNDLKLLKLLVGILSMRARPLAFEEFYQKLGRMIRPPTSRKRSGRPKSKLTTADYVASWIKYRFDLYLALLPEALERLDAKLPPLGIPGLRMIDVNYHRLFRKYALPEGESAADTANEWLSFNVGAGFALVLVRNLVLGAVLEDMREIIRVGKTVQAGLRSAELLKGWLTERGVSPILAKTYEDFLIKHLPNDLVRKCRKPRFSVSDIDRFYQTIQSIKGLPYVNEVGRLLKKTDLEVMDLFEAALQSRRYGRVGKGTRINYKKRGHGSKRTLDIGYDKEGRAFFVI